MQDPALQQWLRPTPELGAEPPDGQPSVARSARQPAAWGTFGRDREEAEVERILLRAQTGEPAFALLVGEPGIGKSRMVEHLSATAAGRGFVVATGRCSQDDGAPPLWPWNQALEDLARHGRQPLAPEVQRLLTSKGTGTAWTAGTESAERRAFRAWESIAHEVLSRTVETPLLLVLEDLHWADTASLRVLHRLLASAAPDHRIAVLGTRRPWPEPTGALAEVGEELARRHVVRVDLVGLSVSDSAALVEDVAGILVPREIVEQWHDRTEGNPFFLIELARLGASEPAAVASLPATVRDVILRRLETIPEQSCSLLLLAAVLGRRCSLDLLAAVAEQPVEAVDDHLVPAREAGLVRDPEAGTLAFTHALTRDAVAATTSASRLARLHARVAHTLEDDVLVAGLVGREERIAELARHWLAAGPSYVSRAWRAAAAAAEQSRRAFSYVESEGLVRAAIEAHRRDPRGSPEERIDLLFKRASDCRLNAEWGQVLPCAAEAIALARRAEDVEQLAAAAASTTHNLVWMSQQWDEVHEDTIDDLRWALKRLPPGDSADRCRLMLSLAVQLYYDPGARAELGALADEGVALARRIGDPDLLWWATRTAWLALWTPTHAPDRLELAREGLEAARAGTEPDAEAVALAALAGSTLEMGDLVGYAHAARETRRAARRRRNSYALLALAWVELSLAAMRADDAEVASRAAELMEYRPRLNPINDGLHLAAIELVPALWNGRLAGRLEPMATAGAMAQNDLGRGILLLGLARAGEIELLREQLSTPLRASVENWSSADAWACQAEAAAVAGNAALAQLMAERLTPLSGRITISGISSVLGPVDGYLALALSASGRSRLASTHADLALAQADEWGLTAYSDWLCARRDQLHF